MLAFALSVVWVAGAGEPPLRIAASGLNAFNVDDKTTSFFLDHFSQQLAIQGGFRVTTQAEIGAVLGLSDARDPPGKR